MDKEVIVSLVSATLLSVTPLLQVLSFAQAASKNVPQQKAQGSTDKSRPMGSSPQTAPGQPQRALAQVQGSQPQEPRPLQRQSSKLSLTLEQSIELALERNLPLQIATLSRDAVSY